MGMGMELRQVLTCSACGEDMQDHDSDCPQGRLEALWNSTTRGRCPACRKGEVLKNAADFLECRACRVQFSVGLICGGEDPDTLETVMIDLCPGDYTPAKRMKTPGEGDFPILKTVHRLHASAVAARTARQKSEEVYRKVYDRTLARELAKIEKKEGGNL